jgi:HlyD family secretion protein
MFLKNQLLCLMCVLLSLFVFCQSTSTIDVETFTVKRQDFISLVTETGELEAVNSQTITAPSISWRYGQLKITKLVEDGKQVQKDEVVVEFDKAEVQKSLDDAKAELEIANAELRKAQATNDSKIDELESDHERSRLQHRIHELNLQQATFKADIEKKQIELDLERAAISLDKARQEIQNQKSINREEISKLELKVQQVQAKLEEALDTLDKLTINAPGPGIAIIKKSWMTDQKFQVDDQLYPGWPMIGLPDLSLMQAKVLINEVDIAKIDTSQKAQIKLDAFPDSSFNAHVSEIATLARNKSRDSKVKVFDAILILSESDSTFMPGMTVSCEIIVEKIPDTLFIPLESLFKKDGNNIVYVENGKGFDERIVSVGQENDDYVIITSGIKEREHVALRDPTELSTIKDDEEKKNGGKG